MAEVLLRHRFEAAGLPARVSSAGLYKGGSPATDHAQATMADRGLDLSHHESRTVEPAMIDQADLVIGMAREHVREAVVLRPDSLERTFTLKELVRLGTVAGPRAAREPLLTWLHRAAGDRSSASMVGVGHDADYDIADPVGGSRLDYETTADELDELLAQLVGLLWPAGEHHEQERSA